MVPLADYNWLRELLSWRNNRAKGLTRYWQITQESVIHVKCHLGWTTEDGTCYKVNKKSHRVEHAVFLALETYDTWMASHVRRQVEQLDQLRRLESESASLGERFLNLGSLEDLMGTEKPKQQ